jgi:hypothetical protein
VLLLVGSPFVIARRLRQVPAWQDLAKPSGIVGMPIVFGVFGVAAGPTAPVRGRIQRVVALLAAGWGILIAVHLYRLARGPRA